jgi:hypothetical protein
MKELIDGDLDLIVGGYTNTSGGPTPSLEDYKQLGDFIHGFFAGFYEAF